MSRIPNTGANIYFGFKTYPINLAISIRYELWDPGWKTIRIRYELTGLYSLMRMRIRDLFHPGSGNQDKKIRSEIRDKYPGSATLLYSEG
jgi:hypothetical protein